MFLEHSSIRAKELSTMSPEPVSFLGPVIPPSKNKGVHVVLRWAGDKEVIEPVSKKWVELVQIILSCALYEVLCLR